MTTKAKIISGFVLMMALLAGLSALGYLQLDEASDDFGEYSMEARTTVFANAADTLLREASAKTHTFTNNLQSDLIDSAIKDIEAVEKYVKEARAIENDQEGIKLLDEQMSRLQQIVVAGDKYRDNMLGAAKFRNEDTLPAGREINTTLSSLVSAAAAVNNTSLLIAVDAAYSAYVDSRVFIRAYLVEQHPEVAAEAERAIQAMGEAVAKMEPLMKWEETRGVHAVLRKNYERYKESTTRMIALVGEANREQVALIAQIEAASKAFDVYTASSQQVMQQLDQATRNDNANAQKLMTAVSGVGMLLALAFAVWIIRGVLRTLKGVSGFASAIAGGDFNARLDVREKGEFGVMAAAIMEIPVVLTSLMHQGKQLAGDISVGHFRSRFDARQFSGGFGELSGCINSVCDAYTGVLDAISSPLMTGDTRCSIRFLNKEAQKVLGGDHTGRKCSDLLKTTLCDSQGCLAKNAISINGPYSKEVTLNPQGKRIEASVVAAPLHAPTGEVDGFMEIITDITAMKDAQNLMLDVSAEAMTIADRVAAASEELSAQVEEVSQGAEAQRERVHSTAAAMNQMNTAVLEVARSAGNASEQSVETRAKANGGADLVNKVVDSITEINRAAVSLQGNMEELGQQAESIGSVISVISDIADQTNLLALNAAIEAARAGEAGRGFAVVADEVRKLAEKTMDATQHVGGNIQTIQHSTLANISEVTEAVRNIGEATSLAAASGKALTEIVELASANSDVVASIATAAEEQSATSDEITTALEEVNRIVTETTEGMTQASSAVHDLAQTAQHLKTVMERLR